MISYLALMLFLLHKLIQLRPLTIPYVNVRFTLELSVFWVVGISNNFIFLNFKILEKLLTRFLAQYCIGKFTHNTTLTC